MELFSGEGDELVRGVEIVGVVAVLRAVEAAGEQRVHKRDMALLQPLDDEREAVRRGVIPHVGEDGRKVAAADGEGEHRVLIGAAERYKMAVVVRHHLAVAPVPEEHVAEIEVRRAGVFLKHMPVDPRLVGKTEGMKG